MYSALVWCFIASLLCARSSYFASAFVISRKGLLRVSTVRKWGEYGRLGTIASGWPACAEPSHAHAIDHGKRGAPYSFLCYVFSPACYAFPLPEWCPDSPLRVKLPVPAVPCARCDCVATCALVEQPVAAR